MRSGTVTVETADIGDDGQQPLLTLAQARALAGSQAPAGLTSLLGWLDDYLMSTHPDLGRTGAVCPFTRQASRLDAVRVAVSAAGPADEAAAFAQVRAAFGQLDAIPVKPAMAHFRTVMIGFPGCGGADGIAMLRRVQDRHKFYALSRHRMVGLMHAQSDAPGLWNADFRPLRAPLPIIAIRHMVEQDAPFAARHPLLLVPYLARFPLAGARRLFAHLRGTR